MFLWFSSSGLRSGVGWGLGAEPPQYFEWGLEYPLAPHPKILYPYKFRLKGAWNYAYSTHQIQFFPLATPQIVAYMCMNFDRKGTEIVHLWFPQIQNLL